MSAQWRSLAFDVSLKSTCRPSLVLAASAVRSFSDIVSECVIEVAPVSSGSRLARHSRLSSGDAVLLVPLLSRDSSGAIVRVGIRARQLLRLRESTGGGGGVEEERHRVSRGAQLAWRIAVFELRKKRKKLRATPPKLSVRELGMR